MSADAISEHGVLTAAGRLGILPATYRLHIEAGERWCGRCERWLPVKVFTPNRRVSSGVRHYCRPCERIRDRARHATKRGGSS